MGEYSRHSRRREDGPSRRVPRKSANAYRGKPFKARLPFAHRLEASAAGVSARTRIVLVAVVFGLFWIALWARAFQVQVVDGPMLAEKAERQHVTALTIKGPRGAIYDNAGRLMANSVEFASVFAHPLEIENPDAAARTLADALGEPRSAIRKKLASKSAFVWISRKIGDRAAAAIREAGHKGVYLTAEYGRKYPHRHLAGQLLGFVGLDEQGLSGLELAYDDRLAGDAVRLTVQRDARGALLRFGPGAALSEIKGEDLHLTIDVHIQLLAQEALKKTVEAHKAKWGGAVVVDVRTNEIRAWAQYPFFNPNEYERYSAKTWRNALAIDAVEQGSTMKPFLVAAAMQEGLVERDSLFFCENGRFKVGRKTIRDTHEYGWLPVNRVLRYSSNIGTAKMGLLLGPKVYHGYLQRLGLGRKTSLNLPGESGGILRPPGEWREIDLVTASFGQGFSLTTPQLVNAFSCLAYKGVLRPLSLVKTPEAQPGQGVRVFSETVADEVLDMLTEVVEEDGTGTRARVPGLRVAGKTGTAQKASPSGGYGGEYVASFVGVLPAADPRYVIAVVVDEPQTNHYGGVVSAPAFQEIAVGALAYAGGLPEAPTVAAACNATRPSETSASARQPAQAAQVSPACTNSVVMRIEKTRKEAAATRPVTPDVVGLSLRQAVERFAQLGVVPQIMEEGANQGALPGAEVVKQQPAAGSAWTAESKAAIWLGAGRRDG